MSLSLSTDRHTEGDRYRYVEWSTCFWFMTQMCLHIIRSDTLTSHNLCALTFLHFAMTLT